MHRLFIWIIGILLFKCPNMLVAQRYCITTVESGQKTSLRGLSVVSDQVIWVSGSAGTVGKSIDGGENWEWMKVKGFEQRDFRDIEAFDENTALIMGIAEPAIILKTIDGGKTWGTVFTDSTKGMFLDAMSFTSQQNGIVIGDPIDGYHFMATTQNAGDTWVIANKQLSNKALAGEAFFASSGTNIQLIKEKNAHLQYVFVTGGKHSRFNINQQYVELPIIQGKESTGANSIVMNESNQSGMIVGGDFAKDTLTQNNSFYFNVDKKGTVHFTAPIVPPHGYRSCVTYINKNRLIACGTSGSDISLDGGKTWELIDTTSFHVAQKAKKGNAVFLAGSKGSIGRLETTPTLQ
jgi:photosystem II stability/assembly factor-like uncharacterized protein